MAGLVAFCTSGSFVSREFSVLLFVYFCFAVILPKLFEKTAPESEPVLSEVSDEVAFAK